MTGRLTAALLSLALAGTAAARQDTVEFAYLYRTGDPAYQVQRAYTGLLLHQRHRPLDGARLAIRDSEMIASAIGLSFELVEREVTDGESATDAIDAARAAGAGIHLLDLPEEEVAAAGRHFRAAKDLILLNVRHGADRLRGEDCSPAMFHVVPSDAMLADAMAQYLNRLDWKKVLLLVGDGESDRTVADTFEAAVRKFGLDIVDRRDFILSNDPRQRDRNNTLLLTGNASYDVVFLADGGGEFGRYLPYSTYLPRPVVGSEGLVASAWHWTLERYGAPQLNQRFHKLAGRPMTDAGFAGWAAVRSVVEAVVRSRSTDPEQLREFLTGDDFNVDLYKGLAGSYRPWDRQLRQPVLLHTGRAVIALAPLEGFLHHRNTLDSLGGDQASSPCLATSANLPAGSGG